MKKRPSGFAVPGPGQESVWDYPRPPAIRPDDRLVTVIFAGQEIARSSSAIRILETSHPPTFYIPPQEVHTSSLEPSQQTSFCEFKGQAVYFDLRAGDRLSRVAAWCYPEPAAAYVSITGYYAIYSNKVDKCTVGGQVVKPQPGDFYGGWITPDVVGPFKGEPGTMSW